MSLAGVILGEGSHADLSAVMRVMDDSFDPRFGEAWTRAQCAGLLPMPGVWLSLARVEGEVAGFALARAVADEAELLLLAVRSTVQGRGIGALLLDEFETAAMNRGALRLHLEVREGNHAFSLYERAGYSLAGRRRNYYSGHAGTTFDALTLAKIAGNLR
jgi:[ribosomal protein S18]-alanine N-acetyltransferase